MNAHVRDCLVTDYEPLIESLTLPDKDDRHVLAAAIKGRCDLIVTMNIKDFPAEELDKYGIEAQHPDDFIFYLMDLVPEAVVSTAKIHRAALKNPLISLTGEPERLWDYGRRGFGGGNSYSSSNSPGWHPGQKWYHR